MRRNDFVAVTSPVIRQQINSFFRSISPVNELEMEEFFNLLQPKQIQAGEFLVEIGSTSRIVGYVCHGLFRVYTISENGSLIVRGFCPESTFAGSFSHVLSHQASISNIEALEDSEVLVFDFGDLESLGDKFSGWGTWLQKYTQYRYIKREEKELQILTLDAEERYDIFVQENAPVLGRVSQADIASAIGITPVSLSRILSKRKNKK